MRLDGVRWLGAAGLRIDAGEWSYLIDPYATRAPFWSLWKAGLEPDRSRVLELLRGLPGRLGGVLVGHTHFDHALDVPLLAPHCEGPLVGSASLAALMGRAAPVSGDGVAGAEVVVCEGGERVELPGGASVTMLAGAHGKVLRGRIPYPGEIEPVGPPLARAREYRVGQVLNPLIEIGDHRVLHIGSADIVDDALAGVECDVVFVAVPGWRYSPRLVERLLAAVRADVIVPFHFDDFIRPLQGGPVLRHLPFVGLEDFVAELRRYGAGQRIVVPELLTPVPLSASRLARAVG